MRGRVRGLGVGLVAALVVSVIAPRASAQTTNEDFLFGLINAKRAAKDKPVLTEHPDILIEVRAHSDDMAQQGVMGHFGFEDRVRRIRAADSGIDNYVCENVAFARGFSSDQLALRVIFKSWRRSIEHKRCMFDMNGFRTRSAAVGLTKSGDTWWATFITAQDSTP
jgi:uncharacterized protein YkwD